MSRSLHRGGLGIAVCLWLSTLVAGCGGGGGGGSGDGPGTLEPPPVGGPPDSPALRLDSSNVVAASTTSVNSAELVLILGQYAINEVQRVARNGSLDFQLPCVVPGTGEQMGTVRYTLQDADANRRPSAGDTMTLQFTRCSVPYLDGITGSSGTLSLRLDTVADAEAGAATGTMDFGSGLVGTPELDGSVITWLGSMRFRRSEQPLRDELGVSSTPADDLRQSIRSSSPSGLQTRTLSFQRPALTRTLDREAARASVTGSLRLVSDTLGGRIDLTFDPQFSAWLNTYADRGSVRLAGASNSTVVIRPGSDSERAIARVDLDANGDGTVDSTSAQPWQTLHLGYLWQESSVPAGISGIHSPTFLGLLDKPTFNQVRGVDVSRALRLQFDRPLAPGTRLFARLEEGTATWGGLYGDTTPSGVQSSNRIIETDVRVQGAAVYIEPREALAWGTSYQILMSDRSDFSDGALILAAEGSAQVQLNLQVANFNTDDRLWAAVTGAGVRSLLLPDRSVTISATTPFATALPLRWRWSQISGPAVVLETPDAPTTSVRLAAGAPSGTGKATLLLTRTDAAGRSASSQVTVRLANPVGMSTLLYLAIAGREVETHLYAPQTGEWEVEGPIEERNRVSLRYVDRDSGARWSIQMAGPGGVAPAVGSYSGAWDLFTLFDGNPATTPMLTIGGDLPCSSQTGRFQVHEIAFDSNRQLERLAVDFEQPCDLRTNDPRTVRGAIRINSTRAFPP